MLKYNLCGDDAPFWTAVETITTAPSSCSGDANAPSPILYVKGSPRPDTAGSFRKLCRCSSRSPALEEFVPPSVIQPVFEIEERVQPGCLSH